MIPLADPARQLGRGVGSVLVARLNPRVVDDPRLSAGQRETLKGVLEKDSAAWVLGLDAKLRPVVKAKLSGPRGSVTYSLLRNGDPAKPVMPLAETWR